MLGTDDGPHLSGVQGGKNEGREVVGGVRRPMSGTVGVGWLPGRLFGPGGRESVLGDAGVPLAGVSSHVDIQGTHLPGRGNRACEGPEEEWA